MKSTEMSVKTDGQTNRLTKFLVHHDGAIAVIEGSEHETFEEILGRAGIAWHETVNVFIGECTGALDEGEEVEDGEDDHKPVERHHKPSHHGHGGGIVHVHFHRCHRIKTGVSYNGQEKHHRFSPATSIETVRRWAVKKFKVAAADADTLFLWLAGAEQPLDGTKHLGDVAHAPHCTVELFLLPDVRVNG